MGKKDQEDIFKVKRGALCFAEGSSVSTEEEDEGKLNMVIYSGGIIRDHWYWGDLAIDVKGLSVPKKRFPILFRHELDRKIAFGLSLDTSKNSVVLGDSKYVDTPDSQEFRKISKEGFPFEASFYAIPTIIEEIKEGEKTEVNGYTFKGPGTIWRKSQFKEASVCEFGYDPNTKSVAMSEDVELAGLHFHGKTSGKKEEKETMNLEELKASHPELYKEIVADVKKEAAAEFSKEKETLQGEIASLKGEKEQFSKTLAEQGQKIASLEKENALRAERDLRDDADKVFSELIGKTNIPERLHEKIRRMISHEGFVKDGKLEKDKFSAAISTELKDWEIPETQILGLTSVTDKDDPNSAKEKKMDEAADRMFAHLGMKGKEGKS